MTGRASADYRENEGGYDHARKAWQDDESPDRIADRRVDGAALRDPAARTIPPSAALSPDARQPMSGGRGPAYDAIVI